MQLYISVCVAVEIAGVDTYVSILYQQNASSWQTSLIYYFSWTVLHPLSLLPPSFLSTFPSLLFSLPPSFLSPSLPLPSSPFLSLPSCPLLCSYLLSGVIDQSGMKITYLSKPRTHNAGIALIGHGVTPLMITPPSVDKFTVVGNCNSGCTEKVRRHMPSSYTPIQDSILCIVQYMYEQYNYMLLRCTHIAHCKT